jgi:hypothetical protein
MKLLPVDKLGAASLAIFAPALTLLANVDYAKTLVHAVLPHVPDVAVPLVASIIVGAAGFGLLHARTPKEASS